MMRETSLSIVTITADDGPGLRATADSIDRLKTLRPEWLSLDWIIIDGGSLRDRPQEDEELNHLLAKADDYERGPDDGIYHAMNKGLARASGTYVWFLNSGDEAQKGVIEALQTVERSGDCPDMFWGQAIYRFGSDKEILTRPRTAGTAWFSGPACHQAILFLRKKLPDPAYDERFRLAGDYDLVARLLTGGASHRVIDHPFCVYLASGASSTYLGQAMREEVQVRREVLGVNFVLAWSLGWIKLVYQQVSNLFPGLKIVLRRMS